MKKIISFLLISLITINLQSQVKLDVVEKGYYRVMLGDSVISNHTKSLKAMSKMLEIKALDSDGTNSNKLIIGYSNQTNKIVYQYIAGSVTSCNIFYQSSDITDIYKVAVKWKVNDFALWVNGVEVATDNSGSVPSANTFDVLKLSGAEGYSPFHGNTKDLRVYTEALTDAQLTKLTTI